MPISRADLERNSQALKRERMTCNHEERIIDRGEHRIECLEWQKIELSNFKLMTAAFRESNDSHVFLF